MLNREKAATFRLAEPLDTMRVQETLDCDADPHRTATVAPGDLNLDFGDGLALQVLQLSGGYEAWHVFDKDIAIHCLGGGDLAIEFPAPAP